MVTVSRLFVYPIKSTAPLELVSADVREQGLAHDRRYVVTDARGRFLTARRFPRMVLINAEIDGRKLCVSAPGAPALELDPDGFDETYDPVTVWRDTLDGQRCGEAADLWFSDYLGMEARLYYMGARSRRPLRGGGSVSFADAAPLLLLAQESVDDLAARLDTPVGVLHFRPNVLVAGDAAYAEDDWPDFRLGAVRFRMLWRCSRCILTTVDPTDGTRQKDGEPFATLRQYRRGDGGEVYFGRNVAPRDTGRIHVGQTLEFD